jgi:hypothetical protein
MAAAKSTQTMKPATAAQKLGIYLPATPPEFSENPVTRDGLNALLAEPPAWLVELRANGPHPRDVVAHKLGVSNSGLARGGITDPLTTAEIKGLLEKQPEWLVRERGIHAQVIEENARIKAERAAEAAERDRR